MNDGPMRPAQRPPSPKAAGQRPRGGRIRCAVRHIFRRYLALGSVRGLKAELDAGGMVSKARVAADGGAYGAKSFSRGALYQILQNRIYLGDIVHKGVAHKGEHAAIVDGELWAKVQTLLDAHRVERAALDDNREPKPLTGIDRKSVV